MTSYRIPGRGRIHPRKKVRFTFDGIAYDGFEGDTLASALLANGVHLVGRSFKYHRRRGLWAGDRGGGAGPVDAGGGPERCSSFS